MSLDQTSPLEALAAARASAARATTEGEVRAAAQSIRNLALKLKAGAWEPYPWQHPHAHPPGWRSLRQEGDGKNARYVGVCDERCAALPPIIIPTHGAWLELGGRGTGKTEGAAHYVNGHAEGPACDPRVPGGHRFTIVAPTQDDAVASCVTGPSGLQAMNPNVTLTTTREGTTVHWPNGSVGRILGAHTQQDLNRFRAWSNVCLVWIEEAAAMRLLGGLSAEGGEAGVLDLLDFTLRAGSRPHSVITTTPKRDPAVQKVLANPAYVRTKGRTRDAVRLDPTVRAALEEKYSGTTLGQQELDAEELKEVPGALWVYSRPELVDGKPNKDERPGLDNDRLELGTVGWQSHHADAPDLGFPHVAHRVVIGVDPPGGRTECGIVVVGFIGGHSYTLADLSIAGPPDTWANVAIDAYYDFGAEGLAAERTFGGDMVDDVIHTRDQSIPILKVSTKVGKRLRAEPVQALSQQHRNHHVGKFPLLENEQTGWVPPKDGETSKDSPNRLDAYVHAVTYGLIRAQATTTYVAQGVIPRPDRRAR